MLSVKMMGLELPNPVIVAAGPWSSGHKQIEKALKSGAGAVVTESIVSEPYPDICPRYAYADKGLQNIRIYSGFNMDKWLEELTIVKENNRFGQRGLVIANIMASSPSELSYLAKKVERAGVDAIELGLAAPVGEGAEIIAGNEVKTYAFTKAAVSAVGIPVIVKLTYSTNNLPQIIRAVERAGASGISAIDALRCILRVDVETGKPILPAYGGLSGSPIRPIGLAMAASIVQSTRLPVIGIGGIESYVNLLEYIMLGASAGGIGTEILLNGYSKVREIIENLECWMAERNINSIEEIRGKGLKELSAIEELRVEPKIAVTTENCHDMQCMECRNCCIPNAVSVAKQKIMIDPMLCNGCGLCAEVCAMGKIKLKYR